MFPGGNIIRVRPTLSTNAYAQGDVLFVETEIPNAVSSRGGVAILEAAYVLDLADDGGNDATIIFSEKNTTAIGTINETADISAENFAANDIIGVAIIDASAGSTGTKIDNLRMNPIMPITGEQEQSSAPLILKAADGSTSVYFSGILTSGTTPIFAADDLQFIFHIKYLG